MTTSFCRFPLRKTPSQLNFEDLLTLLPALVIGKKNDSKRCRLYPNCGRREKNTIQKKGEFLLEICERVYVHSASKLKQKKNQLNKKLRQRCQSRKREHYTAYGSFSQHAYAVHRCKWNSDQLFWCSIFINYVFFFLFVLLSPSCFLRMCACVMDYFFFRTLLKCSIEIICFTFCYYRANNAKINFREKEKKVLDQILGQGKYDARIRPSGINGTGKWIYAVPPLQFFINIFFI